MLPSILNDSTAFWLDFEGSGLPETSEIDEKLSLEVPCFFSNKKNAQDLFFQISGSILGSVLEPRPANKCEMRASIFGFFLEGAFSKFGLAFSLQKHVFYEGVFQNLAFRSRVGSKVPHTWSKRYLK